MDFTMDIEKCTYIVKQYETLIETLNQYITDYYGIIDELGKGWEGLAKEQYFNLAIIWASQCSNLVKDIDDFKKNLNSNLPNAGALLDRGKALKL